MINVDPLDALLQPQTFFQHREKKSSLPTGRTLNPWNELSGHTRELHTPKIHRFNPGVQRLVDLFLVIPIR